MKPLKKKVKVPHESKLTREVVVPWLKEQGFTVVVKMHGNRFSKKGCPDLYAFRPSRADQDPDEHRWFEVKKPDGKLEASQAKLFAEWEALGIVVQVLCVWPDGRVEADKWQEWPVKPTKTRKFQ